MSIRSVKFSDLEKKTLLPRQERGDELYEVVDRQTGSTYTLKEFSSPFDPSLRAEIIREFLNLRKLNHPNLVKCYQLFEMGDNKISLLLEGMFSGSLLGSRFRSPYRLVEVAYQVLCGLNYLHQNKIWHGEVKLSNILSNHREVKVLYLGKLLSMGSKSSGIRRIHDDLSWDLWSFGLSILKLYKDSDLRFKGRASVEFTNTDEVSSSSQAIKETSEELWRFIQCCMSTDLSQRWTAETLLRHPVFKLQRSRDLIIKTGDTSVNTTLTLQTGGTSEPSFPSLESKPILSSRKEEHVILKSTQAHYKIVPSSGAESYLSMTSASTITYGEEDQMSPKKKKSKIFVSDDDSMNIVETSKDSTEKGYFGRHGTSDYLSRCLRHCFLFLPDCEFEKDKLIQMWIAEECIEVEGTGRAEDVASVCFDDLVNEEVITPTRFNNSLHRDRMYKVNTAQGSTWFPEHSGYLRIVEDQWDKIPGETLHLLCKCKSFDRTLSRALETSKQLRTLRVVKDRGFLNKPLPNGIFLGLKDLRTLDLSDGDIFELPGSVGTLKSLRYLDVSNTSIKALPESTTRLSHLQTLKLRNCSRLHALPKEFRNFKKLRHLDLNIVGQLGSMPKGMGNLTELQTLKGFLVGRDDGFRIEELENMNEITGPFSIYGLENVSSAEETKKAALADKKRIDDLVLRWNDRAISDASKDTTEILECLQPHFGLKELTIICFHGLKLPTWICNPSFTNLSSITLLKCTGCDLLPSLGELPSLKILHIVEMESVRHISNTFCRSASDKKTGAFLKLEKLKLDNMLNLEEWSGIEDGDLPSLRHVCIRYCPKLTVLPSVSYLYSLQHLELCYCMQLTSLPEGLLPNSVETLIINECPEVQKRCLKDEGEDWHKIASIKEVWIDFDRLSL